MKIVRLDEGHRYCKQRNYRICGKCGYPESHPLQWCPKCGGKFVPRRICTHEFKATLKAWKKEHEE